MSVAIAIIITALDLDLSIHNVLYTIDVLTIPFLYFIFITTIFIDIAFYYPTVKTPLQIFVLTILN